MADLRLLNFLALVDRSRTDPRAPSGTGSNKIIEFKADISLNFKRIFVPKVGTVRHHSWNRFKQNN